MKFTPKINKAIMIASRVHLGQTRKADTTPYISHPFAVAMILLEYTNDENTIIAGILHDILEDVKSDIYTKSQMIEDFGAEITKIVEEVSEDKDPNIKIDKRATWLERKEKYLENLHQGSQPALLVSVADKIHNLMSLTISYQKEGDKIWDNFNAPKDKAKWFYSEIINIVKNRLNNPITRELERVFKESPL